MLVGIVLLILFIKFQYPDMYDTGRDVAVNAYDGFTSDTDTDDSINLSDDNTDAEGLINLSGEVIGFPYTEFNCTDDLDCSMYEKDAYCNTITGECLYV